MDDGSSELPADLLAFIDRLIVPLLVERLLADTEHLYSDAETRYDPSGGILRCGEEMCA
jgi:hypothetical protein